MDVICFHNPDGAYGFLSNWYPSTFTIGGTVFSSLEQYMMWSKATLFGDKEIADKILAAENPSVIKELGRSVSGYNDNYWNGVRQIIVYEGLLAKFGQNEDLRNRLKATGATVLAECAVKDRIWGTGLSINDPDRFDQTKWNGQNLLGYTLMKVRERIFNE